MELVEKVRHTVRSREDYTRNHVKSLSSKLNEIELSRIQTLLEIASSLQMIHKIVNHMFLTAKNKKLPLNFTCSNDPSISYGTCKSNGCCYSCI